MSDEPSESVRSLYRAALGLGLVAVGWSLAIVAGQNEDDSAFPWVIPVAAVVIGGALFLQARRAGRGQD